MSRNPGEEEEHAEEIPLFSTNNAPSGSQPTPPSSHPAPDADFLRTILGFQPTHGPFQQPFHPDPVTSLLWQASAGNHPLLFASVPPQQRHLQIFSQPPVSRPGDLFDFLPGSLRTTGPPFPNVTPDQIAANRNSAPLFAWAARNGITEGTVAGGHIPVTDWEGFAGNGGPLRTLVPRITAQDVVDAARNASDQQVTAGRMGNQLDDEGGANGERDSDEAEFDEYDDEDEEYGITVDEELSEVLGQFPVSLTPGIMAQDAVAAGTAPDQQVTGTGTASGLEVEDGADEDEDEGGEDDEESGEEESSVTGDEEPVEEFDQYAAAYWMLENEEH
ncbi:MAG: hypothetical protein Q9174_007019 [Haloplaca sp. 1 TL-2023]